VCACEACWALYSGDAEYRPTGCGRCGWINASTVTPRRGRAFQIPIGLAFFMRSTVTGGVVAFYPSPAGATESELSLDVLGRAGRAQPVLEHLDPMPRRSSSTAPPSPTSTRSLPIDDCYALVGLIKSRWEGISGGAAIEQAVPEFFEAIRARSGGAMSVPRCTGTGGGPAGRRRDDPRPQFAVTGAAHLAYAAAPTMVFTAGATEPTRGSRSSRSP
jgi:hypothetical protein